MNAPVPSPMMSGATGLAVSDPGLDPLAAGASPPPLDLRALIGTALRGLPILAACMVVGVVLGFVAINVLPAKYTSSVSILIDPKRPDQLGAEAAFANLYVDSGRVASVEQIIVSSALLSKVVAKEHLADDPSLNARPGLLRRLSAAVFDAPLPAPDNTPAGRMARAVDRLAKSIRTGRVGLTYVIKVDVTAADPLLAQKLANDVADGYIADQLDEKYAAARNDANWLNAQLQDLRRQVAVSEAKVDDIRQRYGLVETDATPGSTLDRQAVASLNGELTQARAEVAEAGAKYSQVQRVGRSGGSLEGLSSVVSSKVIEDLRTQQAAANRKVADLSRRFTANYPELQAARADRNTLDAQVSMEVSRIVSGLKNDYEAAVSRRDALQAEISQMVGATTAVASSQARVALREAERVASANRQAYEASLARLRDVQQQETREEVEARIISKPQIPAAPSFPVAPLFLGGGGGAGLLAGICLVFLSPRLQGRLTDPEDIKSFLRLPVLAMAPSVTKADLRDGQERLSIPDYLLARPISHYAESLRMLRLGIQNAADGAHVIQVTSSVPGEGKSTLAASIALSAASVGKRTILVDLDLYNPAVGRFFGEYPAEGIVEAIEQGNASRFISRAHDILPLYVIAAGSQSRPRPDVLESDKLATLLADLAQNFDLVVLDTPPVLAISDPIRISNLCHATVMVVAWSDTHRDMVEQAVLALRTARAPLAGLVLNKVDLKKTGMYGGKTYTYTPYSSG